MRLSIHYFSATGNTARAVEIIRRAFAAKGWETEAHAIRRGARAPAGEADLTLIAFPTIAFDMPTFVAGYLRSMPPSRGGKAAVFATYGGNPYGSLQKAASILGKRGYGIVLTGGAQYPDNWTQMMNPPAPAEAEKMRAGGDAEAAAYAARLLAGGGGRHPAKASAVTIAISALFRSFGRRFLGLAFIADARCNGCGLCARTCPVRTIAMAGGRLKRPRWGASCADCGRCINLCPKAAIQTSVLKLGLHFLANAAIVIGAIIAARPVDRLAAGWGEGAWRIPLDVLFMAALVIAALWVEFVPFERAIAWLGRRTSLGKLFARSFTAKFRRYRAPGFTATE